jgi:recombination protein RecT
VSTNQLRAATAAQKEPRGFLELIDSMKPEIARALPRHINADRMARIATTEYRKNPKLGDCEIRSVFGAIITLSQLGLEPGVLGAAYLIPYKGKCTAVPGWQGLADLVARAGRASVWTGAVYEGDDFDYAFGDRPHITHRPSQEDEAPGPEKLTYVYAVGRIKGAEWPVIDVWSRSKVEKHRNRFNKVGSDHYSFQHFEMYARKVVLLQVIKYMPKSVELQNAVNLEEASKAGLTIDLKQAASGWVPTAEEAQAAAGEEAGKPLPTIPEAIALVKATKTLKENEEVYQGIVNAFAATNQKFPVEIEGAYTDHKTALEQKL